MSLLTAQFLQHVAYTIRTNCLRMTTIAGSGHPTSCLSAADIVSVLFFYAMQFDPHDADTFILSKGHASPLLYAAWHELGKISANELLSYRDIASDLEGHPTYRFAYAHAATGSLGQGLSIALGIAIGNRIMKKTAFTYCLMGDSELAEGSVWEAAHVAGYYNTSNLVAIVDLNRLGQSTETMEGWRTQSVLEKFAAFGWQAYEVDGHSIESLMHVFKQARSDESDKPRIIIARTLKGYGIADIENKEGWHGKVLPADRLPAALQELDERFSHRLAQKEYETMREQQQKKVQNYTLPKNHTHINYALPGLMIDGTSMATRKAYGLALEDAGQACASLIVLDAEVKNSTYAELFEKKYPHRFIQAFIAEQNMVGMAVGCAVQGLMTFASTFGAFFTRAFDQIRMAALSKAPLRLCGSHAGISIGQDGPSQMALEDIAMMRSIPESIILYPADAYCAYRCVELMLNHHDSISYLRTTRAETSLLYGNHETFNIGGSKVLHAYQDATITILAAGITVHEAIKAHDELKKKHILVNVIDLYSIKPFDQETVIKHARNSNNKLLIVEDHYAQGGIGEMVKAALCNHNFSIYSLAVTNIPRSGKPQELLSWAGIDAHAIQDKILELS